MPSRRPRAERPDVLVPELLRIGNLLVRQLTTIFSEFGVTPQQWTILRVIARSETPLTMAELSRKMAVSKQNITGMVNRMGSLGLIRRSGDPADLRAVRLTVTAEGKRLLETLDEAFLQWWETALVEFPDSMSRRLGELVEKLTAAIER